MGRKSRATWARRRAACALAVLKGETETALAFMRKYRHKARFWRYGR